MAHGGTGNGRRLRLACVATRTPNGHYRVIVPMQAMARRGHTVHWPGDHTFLTMRDGGTPPWDLMHIQQMHDAEGLEIIARMRRAGIAVVWDTDDDISAVTRGSEAWHRQGGRRGVRRHFKQALQAAAGEHEPDLRRMRLGETLERLLERHDGVRVVAVGVDLRLRSQHRYQHLRDVEIDELIPTESEFDIGLAPLRDTAFNRARSNVKLKEYAAAGAMWLASPVGPYAGMGEEQGGLLVRDDEWLAVLESLITDVDRRRALAERAGAWVRGQTIRAGAERWQAAYRGAVERARGGG